jgi:hypothetical protein
MFCLADLIILPRKKNIVIFYSVLNLSILIFWSTVETTFGQHFDIGTKLTHQSTKVYRCMCNIHMNSKKAFIWLA